ncbi:3-ketoacyl-ACP reductase [Alicyclobacillus acidocaldarius]|uniref:Short-chain dehydrogenase/reductase SDR n=1 Tax=Alicyclobacillus acidocaldarius subsp. acidocaldarius (strain ATCC 27009 / DSM 446 / BCRC 14685 / JCM 5260 / KCTC 1825 / NBRC 15652 / NCIMB 11725 / NRRL B-14509 / 104-IA) TaxID=521098 RepID=C8WR26_ALIAD|nr:3-ketoacyl-ACP reductase [Alicyclobacillus acidocaldarius]ACV59195.1 short-chain dehydrogenase/reductase SDR [Alicyclobacillus acidocaldarius subsp. acidocaldarius DSM 446]
MAQSLKGWSAIVTGAGKGIGKAIAEHLAKEGVHLGLIARTESDLNRVADAIRSAYGISVYTQAADIADRMSIESAIQRLKEQLGSVDVLVNNAGTASFGTVIDMPVEEWERIVRVNLLGTYYATRAILPHMIERNRGHIINISSTAGEKGSATTSAYSASKFGLLGFTESLMYEVRKHNIRVMALLPSTVNTDLARNVGLKLGDEDHQMQPEDVAELVVDALRLPNRVLLKSATLIMTNPQ